MAAVTQRLDERLVRLFVELHDALALHVHLAGVTEHVDQARAADLAGDALRGEADLVEQGRERPRRPRRAQHAVHDEGLERHSGSVAGPRVRFTHIPSIPRPRALSTLRTCENLY